MQTLKKIVVIGPESTGKSTRAESLAKQYDTVWCPEYAREYLLKNGMDYRYEDLLTIAKGQIAGEEALADEVVDVLLHLVARPIDLQRDVTDPHFAARRVLQFARAGGRAVNVFQSMRRHLVQALARVRQMERARGAL